MPESTDALIAVAVGNTRTRIGRFDRRDLIEPVSERNDDPRAVLAAVRRACESVHGAPVVLASVSPAISESLAAELSAGGDVEVLRIGRDIPLDMPVALDDPRTVGQDRLLCALGASVRAEQACAVVDAGTAITVDFVDGQGVFQGGVIAPGLRLMLASLHTGTAQLPELTLEKPDPARGPYGKDTRHAMMLGVIAAARGLVRYTIEQYAEAYQAFPQIIATGGDAPLLFEHDDLIEHLVPDLQLIGIREACARAWGEVESSPESDDDADAE